MTSERARSPLPIGPVLGDLLGIARALRTLRGRNRNVDRGFDPAHLNASLGPGSRIVCPSRTR